MSIGVKTGEMVTLQQQPRNSLPLASGTGCFLWLPEYRSNVTRLCFNALCSRPAYSTLFFCLKCLLQYLSLLVNVSTHKIIGSFERKAIFIGNNGRTIPILNAIDPLYGLSYTGIAKCDIFLKATHSSLQR